jgi:hypothetical protein
MAAEITVDFDAATQSLSALNAAAYRLAGIATCQIDKDGTRYVCRLTPNGQRKSESLRSRYLELVTDENVREDCGQRPSRSAISFSRGVRLAGRSIEIARTARYALAFGRRHGSVSHR